MSEENHHTSTITRTTVQYGFNAVSPLISSMNHLVTLSRMMSVDALEGVQSTVEQVALLVYLIDQVGLAVDVFDAEVGSEDLPF